MERAVLSVKVDSDLYTRIEKMRKDYGMTKSEILTLSLSILVNNYEEYQRTTTELFQKKAKGFDFQVSSCETHKQTRVKGFDSSVLDLGNRADTPMRGNFGGALDAVSKTS